MPELPKVDLDYKEVERPGFGRMRLSDMYIPAAAPAAEKVEISKAFAEPQQQTAPLTAADALAQRLANRNRKEVSSDEEADEHAPPPAPAPSQKARAPSVQYDDTVDDANRNARLAEEEERKRVPNEQAAAVEAANAKADPTSAEMDPGMTNIYGLPAAALMKIWETATIADVVPSWMGAPLVVTLTQTVSDVAKLMAVEHASACLVLDPVQKAYVGLFTDHHLCAALTKAAVACVSSGNQVPPTAAELLELHNGTPPLVESVMSERGLPHNRFHTLPFSTPLIKALKLVTDARGPPTGVVPVSFTVAGGDPRLIVVTDKPGGEPKGMLSPAMLLNYFFETVLKSNDSTIAGPMSQSTLADLRLGPSPQTLLDTAARCTVGLPNSEPSKPAQNATFFRGTDNKAVPTVADFLPNLPSACTLVNALQALSFVPSWRLPICTADLTAAVNGRQRALSDAGTATKKTQPDVESFNAGHIKYLFMELDLWGNANARTGAASPTNNPAAKPAATSLPHLDLECVKFLSALRKHLLRMKIVDDIDTGGFMPHEDSAADPASNPMGFAAAVTTDTTLRQTIKLGFASIPPLGTQAPSARSDKVPPHFVSPLRYCQSWLHSHFVWLKEEGHVALPADGTQSNVLDKLSKGLFGESMNNVIVKEPIVVGALDILDVLAVFNPLASDISLVPTRNRNAMHPGLYLPLKSPSASFLGPQAMRIGFKWDPYVLRQPAQRAAATPSLPPPSVSRQPTVYRQSSVAPSPRSFNAPSPSASTYIPPPSNFARTSTLPSIFGPSSPTNFSAMPSPKPAIPLPIARSKTKTELLREAQEAKQKNEEDEDEVAIPIGESHF